VMSWPDVEALDRRESFDGVGNFGCDLLPAAIMRRCGANGAKTAVEPLHEEAISVSGSSEIVEVS
jgi:hypothetical protein